MTRFFLLLSLLCFGQSLVGQTKYTVSGYVREQGSSELLPGATVYVPALKAGIATNSYGFYSLTLPEGTHEILFSSVGYQAVKHTFLLKADTSLSIYLEVASNELEGVDIVADEEKAKISEEVQMSVVSIPVDQIRDIPALMGEKDVLKALQLLPGIQSGSEGSSGLYVRGGGPDQNLIMLDDAPVYNAYHLFGFFSVFNGDALKSVTLYKGGFPARFGGRLSSVIKLDMKDGHKEKFHGKVAVGLISSSMSLEGPLKKNKSSFLISARRTYLDVLTRPMMPKGFDAGYFFYDLNAKVNYDFGPKNKLFLSGYFGQDKFFSRDRYSKVSLGWQNATGTLRWNHLFNPKLFANTSLIFSHYNFFVKADEKYSGDRFLLNYFSGINDYTIKTDFDYLPSPEHAIRMGGQLTRHVFSPYAVVVKEGDETTLEQKQSLGSFEGALYIEDEYRMKQLPELTILGGLRLSAFRQKEKTYAKLEPRLAMSYMLRKNLSAKASFSSMNQYIHLLSNSGIGLPTDLWVSSTDRIAPQSSWQVAVGMAKDLPESNLSLSVEAYYKKSSNIIQYKEGASFLLLDDPQSAQRTSWQDNITFGQNWAYGAEFLVQRKFGKFSGWVGYTLSWNQMQFDSLNFGKKFYARYDRRHDISVVGVYKPNKKITTSFTWVYGTGNRFTLAKGLYQRDRSLLEQWYQNDLVSYYPERNNFRGEAYHRLDASIQFHKELKRGVRTWEVSVYNAYGRANPFFYAIEYEQVDNGSNDTYKMQLMRVALFPLLPSVSYKWVF